ncbi:MAG: CBS domain-containing protein, partial [Candidatus Wallbacteria bacterium]|nr:CBS domain-containing protein [Candidatus Wallbacteria bacterium]
MKQIIASHPHIDFDALASMIAAAKLYPEACLFMPCCIPSKIRQFIDLYLTHYPWMHKQKITDKFQRLVLVDTFRAGDVAELLSSEAEVTVIDHHPGARKFIDIENSAGNLQFTFQTGDTGANVTLLWEQIRDLNIRCTPLEYTLFLLGIHEDTGSCTSSSTTWRDASAMAELLKAGASLRIVQDFLEIHFSPVQEDVYTSLSSHREIWEINGNMVSFYWTKTKQYIEDADVVVQRLMKNDGVKSVFCLLAMEKKSYLIARSSNERVPAGDILSELGGGGHPQAASATLDFTDCNKVKEKLLTVLHQKVKPGLKASDIMQKPVISANVNTSVGEANKIILRYGFGGLPVLDNDGKLAGVITRSDMDKAILHGYSHAPVRAYMTRKVVSFPPDALLEQLESTMMQRQISRLPIIDSSGNIAGIVCRGDLLNSIHSGLYERYANHTTYLQTSPAKPESVSNILSLLPEEGRVILEKIGSLADAFPVGVFLVGGIVRDLLLGRSIQDIDVVIEGDALEFCRFLSSRFRGCQIHYYEKFRTASLKVKSSR